MIPIPGLFERLLVFVLLSRRNLEFKSHTTQIMENMILIFKRFIISLNGSYA